MTTGTYTKAGQMQFWGTSKNPEKGPGTAFHADCCPCPCWSFTDDFDRPDSTDLGDDWHEVEGDWGIVSYELREKWGGGGTADAIVMHTSAPDSMSDNGMEVSVKILAAEEEDVFYLYSHANGYTSDAGALAVKFERLVDDPVDGEQWQITIPGGGVDGQVIQRPSPGVFDPPMPPGSVIASVCTDRRATQVKASIASLDPFAWAVGLDPGAGKYVGLGHDNERETGWGARFDDFFATEMRTSVELCSDCYCFCDTFAVPRYLHAEIFDGTGRSGCLNGLEWDMDWTWDTMGGAIDAWQGDALMPTPDIGGTVTQRFYLQCTAETIEGDVFSQFQLTPEATSPTSGCQFKNTVLLADPDDSTCDPFALVFGPYTMTYSDLSCYVCRNPDGLVDPGPPWTSGTFYIRITEA